MVRAWVALALFLVPVASVAAGGVAVAPCSEGSVQVVEGFAPVATAASIEFDSGPFTCYTLSVGPLGFGYHGALVVTLTDSVGNMASVSARCDLAAGLEIAGLPGCVPNGGMSPTLVPGTMTLAASATDPTGLVPIGSWAGTAVFGDPS